MQTPVNELTSNPQSYLQGTRVHLGLLSFLRLGFHSGKWAEGLHFAELLQPHAGVIDHWKEGALLLLDYEFLEASLQGNTPLGSEQVRGGISYHDSLVMVHCPQFWLFGETWGGGEGEGG